MTGDRRFLDWARRIGDAYVLEVLPGSFGVPAMTWNFETHTGERRLRLRDHGNETVVGLVMLFSLEHELGSPRADAVSPGAAAHARSHPGLGQPRRDALQRGRPRDAEAARHRPVGQLGLRLRRALRLLPGHRPRRRIATRCAPCSRNLPKYRKHVWEPRRDAPLGSFDGYADAIESAIYLANREPVPEAFDWIDSEMDVMLAHAAARRPHRGLVRRGQLQPHRAALRLHEEPGRAAGALGARRRVGACATATRLRPQPRHAGAARASSSTPRGTAAC